MSDQTPGRVPPTHTRFKPGQSGNPRGRPKGSKNLKTVLEKELSKLITVTEGGRTVRRTKLEVMMTRVTHDALKGNPRAVQQVLSLARELGVGEAQGSPAAATPDFQASILEPAAMRRIVRRFEHLLDEEGAEP